MTQALTFYTNPNSRGRIVRWMLEEVGQPYDTQYLDYGPAMASPEYRAINPMGKVPALRHGDAVVTESAAICAYLADAFPEAGLAPDLKDRAGYYRWLFFAAGPLEAAIINKAMGFELPEGRERMAGYGTYTMALDTLEQALSGDGFIVGETLTAADVYVGSQIDFGLRFNTVEQRPAFQAYADRLRARPAYERANALDDAAEKEAEALSR